jgi:hypothetical protein
MTNLLQAISCLVKNSIPDLLRSSKGKNRINIVGDSLEAFIRDIFAAIL